MQINSSNMGDVCFTYCRFSEFKEMESSIYKHCDNPELKEKLSRISSLAHKIMSKAENHKFGLQLETNDMFLFGEELCLLRKMAGPQIDIDYEDWLAGSRTIFYLLIPRLSKEAENETSVKDLLTNLKSYPMFFSELLDHMLYHQSSNDFKSNRGKEIPKIDFSELVADDDEINQKLVLLMCCQENPDLSRIFRKLKYSDEQMQVIADKLLEKQMEHHFKSKGDWLVKNLTQIPFEDEEMRKRLIEKIINTSKFDGPSNVANNFDKFMITDEAFKEKMALEIAHKNYDSLAENIGKFNLKNEKFREELALMDLDNLDDYSGLIDNIGAFSLTDEAFKKKLILRIVSKIEGDQDRDYYDSILKTLVEKIDDFQIHDQEFLYKLALKLSKYPSVAEAMIEDNGFSRFESGDRIKDERLLFCIMQTPSSAMKIIESLHSEIKKLKTEDFSEELSQDIDESKIFLKLIYGLMHPRTMVDVGRIYDDVTINKMDFMNPAITQVLCFISSLRLEETTLEELIHNSISPLLNENGVFLVAMNRIDRLKKDERKWNALLELGLDEKQLTQAFMFGVGRKNKKMTPVFNKELIKKVRNLKIGRKAIQKEIEALRKLELAIADFRSIVQDIAINKDDETKEISILWLTNFVTNLAYRIPTNNQELIFNSGMIKSLYNLVPPEKQYISPDRRMALTEMFFNYCASCSDEREMREWVNSLQPEWSLSLKLILKHAQDVEELAIHPDFIETLQKPPKKTSRSGIQYRNRFLKTERCKWLHEELIMRISESSEFSSDFYERFFAYLAHLSDRELESELNSFKVILKNNLSERLTIDPDGEEKNQIQQCLYQVIGEMIPDIKEDLLSPNCMNVFSTHRNPEALLIYVFKMRHLPSHEKDKMIPVVSNFIHDIATKNFTKNRYEDSEHLETIFSSREGLKEKWKENRSGSLNEFLPKKEIEEKKFPIHTFMIERLENHHLLDVEQLPQLSKALHIECDPIDLTLGKKSEAIMKLDELLTQLVTHFDSCTIDLISEIREALKVVQSESETESYSRFEFFNDLIVLENVLKKPEVSLKVTDKKRIVISDDPLDLFLCGTEVEGSCQRVNGDPNYNKALMGYVMDGKHKLLAIKDNEGKIKGRAILRLHWDEEQKKPVIYMETIYPGNMRSNEKEALVNFAIQYAKELKVDLVSDQNNGKDLYKGKIVSLGLKAPYEYCDAGRGIVDEPYTMHSSAAILYSPTSVSSE